MVRRLLIGLVIGLVVGGLLAAAFVAGLKVTVFEGATGILLAYVAAAVGGVATGLFAGKPIWASGAKVEAGLKAFFGALLAVGGMFALRQWGGAWDVDLNGVGHLGHGAAGSLPALSLPLIAGALGALFELDNTDDKPEKAEPKALPSSAPRKRVAAGAAASNGKAGPSAAPADDVASAPEERRARR
jgi:hypothetical protein